MAKVNLQTITEAEIMEFLPGKEMSVVELSNALNRNYYTVRNAIANLHEQGLVAPKDTYTFRNVKYLINDGKTGGHNVMPMITNAGNPFKLIDVLSARHTVEPSASKAAKNLPMYVTRVLMTALKLHKNKIVTPDSIEFTRTAMQQDLERLENIVSIYKQILNNQVIWNPEFLKRFPRDEQFNEDEVQEAYEYYYATEEES